MCSTHTLDVFSGVYLGTRQVCLFSTMLLICTMSKPTCTSVLFDQLTIVCVKYGIFVPLYNTDKIHDKIVGIVILGEG